MASQRVGCCSDQLETDGAKDTSGWQAKSQPTTIAHKLVRLTESVVVCTVLCDTGVTV